jgi:hypothetical protein
VISANLSSGDSCSSFCSVSEVEGVFWVVFLVLMRRLVAGGVLKRSALSISVRSSLERVDRWLISVTNMRFVRSWQHGLGALRNAEYSHAQQVITIYYGTPAHELLFLFFFSLVFSIDSNLHL